MENANTSPSPVGTPAEAPDLLSELLSAFGTLPPKGPRVRGKPAPKALAQVLPLHNEFARRKTGYITWKAIGRNLQVQRQICNCCSGEIEFIKAEFFILENGTAHATWLRAEGYGIEAEEDLPITYTDLEPAFVPACASCRSTPFDDLESLFHPRQLSLVL